MNVSGGPCVIIRTIWRRIYTKQNYCLAHQLGNALYLLYENNIMQRSRYFQGRKSKKWSHTLHGPSCFIDEKFINKWKFASSFCVLTVESGWTGCTKFLKSTFPSHAILARVWEYAFPGSSGSYGGQWGAGDEFGFLAKFANAVWRLFESSTSSEVAVDLSNVPKRIGTTKRERH